MLYCKLKIAEQTLTSIALAYGFIVNGKTPLTIAKHFNFLIIRSTWMRDVAILLDMVEVSEDATLFLIIGGAINFVWRSANKSWTLDPLSAIITSPGSKWSKNPLFLMISLSLMLPLEVRHKIDVCNGRDWHQQFKSVPWLVIAIGASLAWQPIWSFNVELCAINDSSKVRDFPKCFRILSTLNSERVVKCSKKFSSFAKNTIQLRTILLAQGTEMPKTLARTVMVRFRRSLTSARISCSHDDSEERLYFC